MVRKFKYGKVALVIILTVLIWVWADLAQDETFEVYGAAISIAKSANPNLWASFDDQSSASIEKIELKGPVSRIAEVKRQLNDGSLVLEFFLDPQQQAMTDPDEHSLDVLAFLKKGDKIRQLGLTVESCQPDTLSVNVVELVEKSLVVECVNEDQSPVKVETIEPTRVDMFVPEGWEGLKLTATVELTTGEIEQARVSAIEKTPYIKLPGGQRRKVPRTVKITMPTEEDQLEDYLITATLGIALSPTLQGKYNVEVTNPDVVMSAISIRATADAKRAYELQPFPTMTLYILDDDKKTTDEQRKKVVYNFPEEFVRNDKIKLKGQPVEARFKLISLPSAEAP